MFRLAIGSDNSASENGNTAGRVDLLLGLLAEELGLDDAGLVRDETLAEDLRVSSQSHVDDGDLLVVRVEIGVLLARLLRHQRPQLLDVDRGAVVLLVRLVEVAHADLTEVTRVVLIHQDAVVVHTTGVTSTTRMLPVLANTTMASRDVTTLLAGVLQPSRHGDSHSVLDADSAHGVRERTDSAYMESRPNADALKNVRT